MIKNILLILLFGSLAPSCAHSVHLIHTSDFDGAVPYEQGVPVIGEGSQGVILGFVTQSNYVDQAYNSLLDQCDGRVTGITTKYSTELGFMSWTNVVRMEGLCVSSSK